MTGVRPSARLGPLRADRCSRARTRRDPNRRRSLAVEPVCRAPGPWRPWPTLSLIGETSMNGERTLIAVPGLTIGVCLGEGRPGYRRRARMTSTFIHGRSGDWRGTPGSQLDRTADRFS